MAMNESQFGNQGAQSGQVWEIDLGYDVFAADGERLGTVEDVQSHYLTVSKGTFFSSESHVPATAISDVQGERVTLGVMRDQIASQNWETVPAASDYSTSSTADTGMDHTRTTDTGNNDMRIPVMEEQLSAGKHEVRRGLVRVHKRVVSEQESVNVPLREETVHVERHAVTGDYSGQMPANAFQDTDIEIELRGEEADVSKRAVVREEVEIDKDVVERNQQVTETVRREEVHVHDADGNMGTTGTSQTSHNPR